MTTLIMIQLTETASGELVDVCLNNIVYLYPIKGRREIQPHGSPKHEPETVGTAIYTHPNYAEENITVKETPSEIRQMVAAYLLAAYSQGSHILPPIMWITKK